MHPLVRDLYKRFITVAQDYPGGWHAVCLARNCSAKACDVTFAAQVRPKVKKAFFQQKHLTDEVDIKQAVNRGRYMT